MKIPQLIERQKRSFATYSIMALSNVQTVLDHIQKVLDIATPQYHDHKGNPKEYNEEEMWEHPVLDYLQASFRSNAYCTEPVKPEKVQTIMDRLMSYFPFLFVMADNQRKYNKREAISAEDVHYVISTIIRVVKAYRNITAHNTPTYEMFEDGSKFLKNESVLANIVNNYYTVALRDTAERYSYTTNDLAFIQDNRIDRRTKRTNFNFFLCPMDYNGDANHKLHLSGVGVAMVVCLLLDKQYINIFLSKLSIYGKYGPQSKERQTILRSMGIRSIRLPKDRIHSEKDEMSVALDMLQELKRCPDELFNALSAFSQEKFRIISKDHNEVLMKRSSDRFAQLMLQYIDHGRKFNGIRFHVNMGKLRYLFTADKHCIDGISRVRVIEHPLNGYGRIDEMEDERKAEDGTFSDSGITIRDFEHVQRNDANPANYPYITDAYTQYILDNNKVEMSFTDHNLMPRIKHTDSGKWYAGKDVPHCRMSTLELTAMAFHVMLLGCDKTEERIKEVYDRYRHLFTAMKHGELDSEKLSEYGIDKRDLPQKVLDSIEGGTKAKDVDRHIKQLLEEMLDDTQRRQERIKEDRRTVMSADNKMGKRSFRSISTGRLAAFLAKDIVRFQPTNASGTDKMTGLNYRIMQSVIATY